MSEWKMAPADSGFNVIRIYSYENKVPEGTIRNEYLGKTFKFYGLTNLLLLADDIADKVESAAKYMDMRSFTGGRPTPLAAVTEREDDRTPIGTYGLRIIFRQNASWQGQLIWTDRKKEICFRSVFELIKLLDETLAESNCVALRA